MEYTVTQESIQYLLNGRREDITIINWKVGLLRKEVLLNTPNVKRIWITERDCVDSLEGIEVCTKLEFLYCSGQPRLVSIQPLKNCLGLKELRCTGSGLVTLEGLKNCLALIYLNVNGNRLSSLRGLEKLSKLKSINASNNRLIELCDLGHRWLEELNLHHNELPSLKGIGYCQNLKTLSCEYNKLTDLCGIEKCSQLETLNCAFNEIAALNIGCSVHNLRKLVCNNNQLVTLRGLGYKYHLMYLIVSNNQLCTLEGIEGATWLIDLDCRHNSLTDLRSIGKCVRLIGLKADHNQLRTIKGTAGCHRLASLSVAYNNLTIIEDLDSCLTLSSIDVSHNQLPSLRGLEMYKQLCTLKCSHNQIISLLPITACPRIETLVFDHNLVTSLDGIETCRDLRIIECEGNPLTDINAVVGLRLYRCEGITEALWISTPQLQRYYQQHANQVSTGMLRTIYGNGQNVHDSQVTKSIAASLRNLMKDPKPAFTIELVLLESSLSEHTKTRLVEYCADTCVHSDHLLSYQELLAYVWARIMRSPHKTELLKVLEEQINDAECMCFTGRFHRTVSVLVGFYPDILITISDSSRISAIILAVKASLIPYDPVKHRELAHQLLIGAGYTEDIAQIWVSAIE